MNRIKQSGSKTARGVSRIAAAAVVLTLVLTANVLAQIVEAKIPFRVNVPAAVSIQPSVGTVGEGASKASVAANVWDTLLIKYDAKTMSDAGHDPGVHTALIPRSSGRRAPHTMVSRGSGAVQLNLPVNAYSSASIALHTMNGRRILSGRAAASKGTFSLSRPNVAPGVYLLAVKGANGGSFATRVPHRGGRLSINAVFVKGTGNSTDMVAAGPGSFGGTWVLTASATGYSTATPTFVPKPGVNDPIDVTLFARPANAHFTETIPFRDRPEQTVSFNMRYVPGGTFDFGCSGNCSGGLYATARSNVSVSPYFIGEMTITTNMWRAVMGGAPLSNTGWPRGSDRYTDMTWYDAQAFACQLSQITGKNYRLLTEAEWEYAAENWQTIGLRDTTGGGNNDEWTYDTYGQSIPSSVSGTTDPIGPGGHIHNQKVRRGGGAHGVAWENMREIRSIEGIGPKLRLAISATTDFPPDMVKPCDLHMPFINDGLIENTYRDMRWVTGDDYEWRSSGTMGGSMSIKVWENGAVRMSGFPSTTGEWYTTNNISFKIATSPTSTSRTAFIYVFVAPDLLSVMPQEGSTFAMGRLEKVRSSSSTSAPSIPGTPVNNLIRSGNVLDQRVDMVNPPTNQQDARLFSPAGRGWRQDNSGMGIHGYRKDVDAENFRFVVFVGRNNNTTLAFGDWYTVGNAFLRVTDNRSHANGPYTVDYLYSVVGDNFYHIGFSAYERGDFRTFQMRDDADIGTGHIPKDAPRSIYAPGGHFGRIGFSTYAPPPCPAGGC